MLQALLFIIHLASLRAMATAASERHDAGPPPPYLPFEPLRTPLECPECESLFSSLEAGVQDVAMTERGEPKSGTGGMFEWAVGSLFRVCQYLNQLYGRTSCKVVWGRWSRGDYYGNHTLVFEPTEQKAEDSPCHCTGVRRVTVTLSKINKHALPVAETCPYAHALGYDLYPNFCDGGGNGQGGPALTFTDISRCVQEAECQITDERQQMVVFRDPRPATVSSYYFLKARRYLQDDLEIDEFVMRHFRTFVKWMAIRLELFTKVLPRERVVIFWYEQWQADAASWHRKLFDAFGLRMPESVTERVVDSALANDFPFYTKGRDPHGDGVTSFTSNYRSEIRSDTAAAIDAIMENCFPRHVLDEMNAWHL